MKAAISKNPEIVFEVPPANVTIEDYVKSVRISIPLDRLGTYKYASCLSPPPLVVPTTGLVPPRSELTAA
jgi:hypothetical protein